MARTYHNSVSLAEVLLDSCTGRTNEAEVRLFLKPAGKAVGTDPLQLIALT